MVFKSGKDWNGNKNGRPVRPEIELLRDAMNEVEEEKKVSLIKHAVRRAYDSDPVLIGMLKKVLPDLAKIEDKRVDNISAILEEFARHRLEMLKKRENDATDTK
jgi:AAA+ ATPase superfamily predicted ATPase